MVCRRSAVFLHWLLEIRNCNGVYGIVQPSGEFTVHDGLPAGKYILAVRQYDSGPQGTDSLKDKFRFKNSKIVEEIYEDRVLDIDLDKYK